MKEFNAKKKTALLAVNILLSILLVMSMCVTVALAVTQFSLNMGGNISFQAKDVQATISEGVVANGTGGENKMKAITLTPDNDVPPDISSWNGLEISFDGKEDVTITFTVTNNHTEEALLFTANVNEGTPNNMTMSMTIDGENKTEVVIPADTNSNDNEVECVVTFHITDQTKSASIKGFAINCDLGVAEGRDVTLEFNEGSAAWYRNLGISVNGGEFYYYNSHYDAKTVILKDVKTLQFKDDDNWSLAPEIQKNKELRVGYITDSYFKIECDKFETEKIYAGTGQESPLYTILDDITFSITACQPD